MGLVFDRSFGINLPLGVIGRHATHFWSLLARCALKRVLFSDVRRLKADGQSALSVLVELAPDVKLHLTFFIKSASPLIGLSLIVRKLISGFLATQLPEDYSKKHLRNRVGNHHKQSDCDKPLVVEALSCLCVSENQDDSKCEWVENDASCDVDQECTCVQEHHVGVQLLFHFVDLVEHLDLGD